MKAVFMEIACGCCLVMLLASPIVAQEQAGEAAEGHRYLELAEDMEIMGRLLHEALQTIYQQSAGGALGSVLRQQAETRLLFGVGVGSDAHVTGHLSSSVVREPLSAYLAGEGIIFQAEAPLPRPETEAESAREKESECPFLSRSPWERAEMSLHRGLASLESCKSCHGPTARKWTVTTHKADRKEAPTRDALVQSLLQVLAENGHHLRHLQPEERITVVLTFQPKRDVDETAVSEESPIYMHALNRRLEALISNQALGQQNKRARQGAEVQPSIIFAQPHSKRSTVQFIPVLPLVGEAAQGDLFLKSQQFDKAIGALEHALKSMGVANLYEHTPDPNQRAIYQKLLQAHVGAGNLEEAQKLIAILQESKKQDATAEKPAPPPLPSRLVVSATKAQLDGVAAGEISREEFAEQVEVRFYEGRDEASDERAAVEGNDLIDPETGGILYDARDSTAPVER